MRDKPVGRANQQRKISRLLRVGQRSRQFLIRFRFLAELEERQHQSGARRLALRIELQLLAIKSERGFVLAAGPLQIRERDPGCR